MEVQKSSIPDVLLIKPDIYRDERGYFFESYNIETFLTAGIGYRFVQDNESRSRKNVLRGLHFQNPPHEQGKLVRVTRGAVLDVAVDIRKNSPYFGKWCSAILSDDNKHMYWIPPGFAHGFLTLEDDTVFLYKCTKVYHKASECTIRWNDPDLAIEWGITDPILTLKDRTATLLKEVNIHF
jgi:dTDP-4-dehydrorhamnose 3,5-epimerase